MKFTSINIQGNLLSEEVLNSIESAHSKGQTAADFGFDSTTSVKDEVEYAWSRVKLDWKHFVEKTSKLPAGDPYGTSLSRRWMEQFLGTLGYQLTRQKSTLIGNNNQTYSISHADEILDKLPIHIVGFIEPDNPGKNTLDIRTSGGTTRLSPHATVQEYLNVSGHLYGIVANGFTLRLIRDSGRLIRLNYIEIDLRRLLDEDKYSEFSLIFRLLHATRLPKTIDSGESSFIESYYQESLASGNRIRDELSKAVKISLHSLGNGFLKHSSNDMIREAIQSGKLSAFEFNHSLLRLIYRLLFLMVTEERDLLFEDDSEKESRRYRNIYKRFYSIEKLRKLSGIRHLSEPQYADLWQGLLYTFKLFEPGGNGPKLGIAPLGGELFSEEALGYLNKAQLSNQVLLDCIRSLNEFEDKVNKTRVFVNYRALDVEELGSIYEGLLELEPEIINDGNTVGFSYTKGTGRSSSGSHYTPEDLVKPLIKHSLEYLIDDRVKEKVSGEWRIASGRYPALENDLKNLILNLAIEYEKLPGSGSMEKGNGFSATDLPINALLSKRRIVWNDFAAPEISRLYTGKHSGGLGQKRQQGIQPVSEHSKRKPEGNGNTLDSGSTSNTLYTGTDSTDAGPLNRIKQANTFLATFHLNEKQLATVWSTLLPENRHSLFATHHLLNLKICDVACGSGHILLSAARRLAMEVARIESGEQQPNPASFRMALRKVIQQCIYGVDKNPLAVELCKVSLWLEAHVPGSPLNFLDHHIKCGDAIVGLAHREELEKGIADEAFKTLPGDDKEIAAAFRKRNQQERKQKLGTLNFDTEISEEVNAVIEKFNLFKNLPENTPDEVTKKEKEYRKFENTVERIRLKQLADAQVAQFFIPKTEQNKAYILTDAEYRAFLKNVNKGMGPIQSQKLAYAESVQMKNRFFHWFLEFPDVFQQKASSTEALAKVGFDCILGNPPFLGDKKIKSAFGDSYIEFLKCNYSPIGVCDLVTYFFRRNFILISEMGYFSLISTNTISQGDTREGGLDQIVANGGEIIFASPSVKWPGQAAVFVSLISITKRKWNRLKFIENRIVNGISTLLSEGNNCEIPHILMENTGQSFIGNYLSGMGFSISNSEGFNLLKNSKNADVVFPFINGDDLNSNPNLVASRHVINFFDWPLSYDIDLKSSNRKSYEQKGSGCAEDYPECLEIVRSRVKPEREKKKDKSSREKWWLHARPRMELYSTIQAEKSVLVVARTSKTLAFIKIPKQIFSDSLVVFSSNNYSKFIILQSFIHEGWAWKYCTTMKTDLVYTPTNTFETFPFPQNLPTKHEQKLESIGESYHELRKQLMLDIQLGLTKTYNLFHSAGITESGADEKAKQVLLLRKHLEKTPGTISFEEAVRGILKLRELHVQMDNAVLEAYGWGGEVSGKWRVANGNEVSGEKVSGEWRVANGNEVSGEKESGERRVANGKKMSQDKETSNDENSTTHHSPLTTHQKPIHLKHDFYEVDYLPENDRIRYTIHPDARKEVLKRLLELNHKIHEEEVKAGLWDKKKYSKPAKKDGKVEEGKGQYGLFE